MAQLKNYREVGIFDLLSAPLNPIGAFDAEQFKKDVRGLLDEKSDEQFLAVDLTGLDFVYSDAYNAFIQFQEEMSSRGGMFVLLTDNKIIIDGLKKAGLDKKIKIIASEEDMMSFSLHAQASSTPSVPEVEPERPMAVASQNKQPSDETSSGTPRVSRPAGNGRRFTKSFNAIAKDETVQQKGLDVPFDNEPSSAKTIVVVVLLLLIAVGATLAFFFIK